ncbi:MAG: response regulator transcription factor [Verrucomicrobiota bacterium]
MDKITIMLADDHAIVRQGLRFLLEAESDFSIVGEAGDGLETLRLLEKLQPAVLVVDVMMPALNGLEVARQVSRRFPQTRVVVLSMHANEAYVLEALRNGALGYVLKCSTAADLVKAIREAIAGRRYLSPPLSDQQIESYIQKARNTQLDRFETLTTREREVLQMVAEGCTSAAIAHRLGISPRTVEVHRGNLMRKLGLQSQTDLIRYALARGILPAERGPS